ncbi:MAG TPA: hypothetical protein VK864_16855, partial [Longimicrobiales bacterium]|nr:hypothetical protein [Longimicrobiales bacterium]
MIKPAFGSALLLAAGFSTAAAQLISIRTVPISQAHQFAIFPSQTVAMGGVSIALRDSLLDPFTNPATGSRVGATRFFGTPSTYSVSSKAGSGRTLPVGALTRSNSWYGGLWLALQQVDPSRQPEIQGPIFLGACPACDAELIDIDRVKRSQGNSYAFATAGRELAPGLSVGGSFLWSHLNAIDGVDMLYARSLRVEQRGDAFDARIGLVKEWAGDRTLEALVLHNRFGTEHDVYFLDTFWDPGAQQFIQQPRIEHNLDRTHTWGLHVEYEQPLSANGWHAGVVATINQMNHPKIPNYSIMNIPRDPGHSSAFNLGFGLARRLNGSTLGIDLIYEPIWSHTWADAESPVESRLGKTIPAGGMTIENHFRFANGIARMGLAQ